MNNILTERYHALKDFQKKTLRERLHDSPKALLLIDFLEKHPSGKFSMNEVVDAVYHEKQVDFATRQNRFFKLRKKLFEYIVPGPAPVAAIHPVVPGVEQPATPAGELLPLESEFFRCREYVNANHFHHAIKQLQKLLRECQRLNVFELMPGIYNMLIYCRHALNEREDVMELSDRMDEASALLFDLQCMQSAHHRIYSIGLTRSTVSLQDQIAKCEAIAKKNSAWPRFNFILHFILMNRGPASSGNDNATLVKSIRSVEKLMQQYPEMPVLSYEKHYGELLQYYLSMSKGIYAFAGGDAESCYVNFKNAWEIIDATPGFRVRKTESLFANKITTELVTGRFQLALRTCDELLEFHRLQKDETQRLKAYSILAMVYTHCFREHPCPNPEFILGKLDDYIRAQKKAGETFATDALATKALFLFMLGRFPQANRIMRKAENAAVFTRYGVPEYVDLLKLSPVSPRSKVNALRQRFRKLYEANEIPGLRHNYKRGLDLLDLL